MTEQEWESLCDGCGKCCDIGGGVACPALGNDKRCTVYENRQKTHTCAKITPQNVKHLHRGGVLPDSCAYVRWSKGLPPEPKEYNLIPFLVSSREVQAKYWRANEKYLASNGQLT